MLRQKFFDFVVYGCHCYDYVLENRKNRRLNEEGKVVVVVSAQKRAFWSGFAKK